MAAKRRKQKPSLNDSTCGREPGESRAAEMLTIAWTVSVTGVLIADLLAVGAHFLAAANPGVPALALMRGLLLLSAAAVGIVSLVLFALAWRNRRLKPPQGYVAFAVLVAAGPIVAVLLQLVL